MKSKLLVVLPILFVCCYGYVAMQKWIIIDEKCSRLELLALRAKHFSSAPDTNSNYITEEVETIPLLAEKRKNIARLSSHPAFASWKDESASHLSFEKKGKTWVQKESVRLTTDELRAVLSQIEGVPIGSYLPSPTRPDLHISSMVLEKKQDEWAILLKIQEGEKAL